jgi:hypothetical protein
MVYILHPCPTKPLILLANASESAKVVLGGCPRISVYSLLIASEDTVRANGVRFPLKSCPLR